MKIIVSENLDPIKVINRAGYGQVRDRRASEISWARRLGEGIYPRFHVYINNNVINLHLDQKQASYQGYSAHSGEYEGEVVEREVERIIEVMNHIDNDFIDENKSQEVKKVSFWRRIFG